MEAGIIVMVVMMLGMMFGMHYFQGKHKEHSQKKNQAQVEMQKSTNSINSNDRSIEHSH